MTCPGCGGPKSKRAQLCARCRRSAIAVGVRVLTTPATSRLPLAPAMTTSLRLAELWPAGSRAYHGKCSALARLSRQPPQQHKRRALEHASSMFGREISSSDELSQDEMGQLLDWLDEQLAAECTD